MELPLSERRVILAKVLSPTAHTGLSHVSYSAQEMIQFVRKPEAVALIEFLEWSVLQRYTDEGVQHDLIKS